MPLTRSAARAVFGVLLVIASAAVPAAAQSAAATTSSSQDEAVLAVVDQFMIGIATNDAALLSRLRFDGSLNVVERPAPNGSGTLLTRRPFPPEGNKPGNYKELYWDPIVHVRGSLAIVWAPYEFWRDGKTTHCGIDVFELAKDQGAWKIGNVMWTVEPDACASLRPADPSKMRPKS